MELKEGAKVANGYVKPWQGLSVKIHTIQEHFYDSCMNNYFFSSPVFPARNRVGAIFTESKSPPRLNKLASDTTRT